MSAHQERFAVPAMPPDAAFGGSLECGEPASALYHVALRQLFFAFDRVGRCVAESQVPETKEAPDGALGRRSGRAMTSA